MGQDLRTCSQYTALAGRVVRLTAGHQAKVEEKPEVRIVDPACGSGSFRRGAYQFLLDWHLAQYLADGPEQWADNSNPQLYRTEQSEWRLTIDERKRILLNNC